MSGEPAGGRLVARARELFTTPEVDWGVCVRDVATGTRLVALAADRVQPIASVGKLLLLIETARRIEAGSLDADLMLARGPGDAVGDSGLWQHLHAPALTVADLAVLVASVSDNLATNVLLRHLGLDAIRLRAAQLGLVDTRLLDRVRDPRGPAAAPTLAVGRADELSGLMADLACGECVSPAVSARVLGWLSTGVDLSMMARTSGLDPLAHATDVAGPVVHLKTGTDAGIRADVGLLALEPARASGTVGRGTLAYAVLARWDPAAGDRRDTVLDRMSTFGRLLLDHLADASSTGDHGH